jgi:hypothetical protein
MSNKIGEQKITLPTNPKDLFQSSFNLDKMDQFVKSLSVTWEHFKGIPSPIGLKDKGSYRRDELDTKSSNGMIYTKAGEFSATMLGANSNKNPIDGGQFDSSMARLVLPRFYDSTEKRIYLSIGDRVYLKDVETLVVSTQFVQHNNNTLIDHLQYPAKCVDSLMDSSGKNYVYGYDFELTPCGKIKWTKSNPGIDPDTGLGRVFSVRYMYQAHWYIQSLPNEVRVTQVTTNGVRKPERLPYHAVIVREYIYHNQVNDDTSSKNSRLSERPIDNVDDSRYPINVELADIEEN